MCASEKYHERAPGTTSMAPGVLLTIARLTALQVPGVVAMAHVPGGVNRLFRKGMENGVRIEVSDEAVGVDMHLVLDSECNVRQVCRAVQTEVSRAIEHMTGMRVERVDVHVEDLAFGTAGA